METQDGLRAMQTGASLGNMSGMSPWTGGLYGLLAALALEELQRPGKEKVGLSNAEITRISPWLKGGAEASMAQGKYENPFVAPLAYGKTGMEMVNKANEEEAKRNALKNTSGAFTQAAALKESVPKETAPPLVPEWHPPMVVPTVVDSPKSDLKLAQTPKYKYWVKKREGDIGHDPTGEYNPWGSYNA
jgi:hypothetical protein